MSNKKKHILVTIIGGFCLSARLNDNTAKPISIKTINCIEGNFYLICYGYPSLYSISHNDETMTDCKIIQKVHTNGYHLGIVLYSGISPYYQLRIDGFLQTLLSEKTVITYSYNEYSNTAAAEYFDLLGYNVKSLLFGYNTLYHDKKRPYPVLEEKAFTGVRIENYNYETGN